MDYNFYKTTRLVNARKVSRSRQTGQCAWVSSILFSLEVSVINNACNFFFKLAFTSHITFGNT